MKTIEAGKVGLGRVAEGIEKASSLIGAIQNQLALVHENNNGAMFPVELTAYQMAAMLEMIERELIQGNFQNFPLIHIVADGCLNFFFGKPQVIRSQ